MAAKLRIADSPAPNWWYSPAISTNPSPPLGPGFANYIWVQVDNFGGTTAGRARIDFFYGNPSTQLRRDTVTFIGSTSDDIPPGGKPVKSPAWVLKPGETGHMCLIVVAHDVTPPFDGSYGGDPAFPFDPPRYPEVAQLNLTVQATGARSILRVPADPDKPKRCTLRVERGGALDAPRLAQLGLQGFRLGPRPRLQVMLNYLDPAAPRSQRQAIDADLSLQIPANATALVEVAIEAPGLKPYEYALIHIVEREAGLITGGCSYLVIDRLSSSAD